MPDPLKQIGPIIFAVIGMILIVIIGFEVVIPTINNAFTPKECSTCDCSPYQNNLTNCTQELNNRQTINNTVYVNITKEIPVEKIVYRDNPTSITIISISFFIAIYLTIKLFKIKLPEKVEEEIKIHTEKIVKAIKILKILSLILVALIIIKLIIIFVSF